MKIFQFIIGLVIFPMALFFTLFVLIEIISDFSEFYAYAISPIMNFNFAFPDGIKKAFLGFLVYSILIGIFGFGIFAWYQLFLVLFSKKTLIDVIYLFGKRK